MREAIESTPCGKITLAVSVFICRHFIEEGLPPNSCASETLKTQNTKHKTIKHILANMQ
jgi:hypothetical protein